MCRCVLVPVQAGVCECAGVQRKLNPVQTVKNNVCKGSSELAAVHTVQLDS